MASPALSLRQFSELLRDPGATDALAAEGPVVMVESRGESMADSPGAETAVSFLERPLAPVVVVAIAPDRDLDSRPPSWCDVQLSPSQVEKAADVIHRCPGASVALALLLRTSERLDVESALVAESSTYSMLQASSEHQDWLARREPPESTRHESTHRVRMERDGNELTVTLDRGEAHNAFDRHMRDGLCEALELAIVDPSIERVHLRGSGPSFCSGGDLHEFGSAGDPAEAHRVRLTRSAARLLARLSDRTDVAIHGHTYGSGIELAAFASRVVAHRDTSIALPELGLGLVPGAGGTASIPRRIGRHRTMELALRQDPLDAPTALSWGLVDAIE